MIFDFIETHGGDYCARLSPRLTESLMLGVELDRPIIWTVAGGFGPFSADLAEERRIGSSEEGFDDLLRLELTDSFRR